MTGRGNVTSDDLFPKVDIYAEKAQAPIKAEMSVDVSPLKEGEVEVIIVCKRPTGGWVSKRTTFKDPKGWTQMIRNRIRSIFEEALRDGR